MVATFFQVKTVQFLEICDVSGHQDTLGRDRVIA